MKRVSRREREKEKEIMGGFKQHKLIRKTRKNKQKDQVRN